jgi:hypothetical protein
VPTVTGIVRDGQGLPAEAAAAVIAFPVEPQAWAAYGLTPRRIKSASTSSSGSFEMTTLPAGEYYLLAVPASQRLAWQDPEFLMRMAPAATRVRVQWGDTTAQDLRLQGQDR